MRASAACSSPLRLDSQPEQQLASPPRASRERSSPNRNAAGTATSEPIAIHSSAFEREPVTRSLISTSANSSSATAPARLGSSARRRGGDAARKRTTTTTNVVRHARNVSERWSLSSTLATSAFAKTPSTLLSSS